MNKVVAILLACFLAVIAASAQESKPANARALFDQGMNAMQGSALSRHEQDAMELFRRSAELGYIPAQVLLGYLYETGQIVSSEPTRAADWYKKAAQQGDAQAAWLLGRMIYLGVLPPQDVNDAAKWLQQASDQNNPFAQYLLGLIKLQKNEYSKAVDLLRSAAERGLPQAQYQFGKLLREAPGGLKRDNFESYVWLLMAADAGYAKYPELNVLESDLGSARTEEAKTTARQREKEFARSVVAHGCTGWEGEFDRIPTPPPPEIQQFCR